MLNQTYCVGCLVQVVLVPQTAQRWLCSVPPTEVGQDRGGIRGGDRAAAAVPEWPPHYQDRMHYDAWAHSKTVVLVAPGDENIGLLDDAIGVDSTSEGCAVLYCLVVGHQFHHL